MDTQSTERKILTDFFKALNGERTGVATPNWLSQGAGLADGTESARTRTAASSPSSWVATACGARYPAIWAVSASCGPSSSLTTR